MKIMQVPIHTVGLETELHLLLNLGFCRSSGDGALVHVPSGPEQAKGRGGPIKDKNLGEHFVGAVGLGASNRRLGAFIFIS